MEVIRRVVTGPDLGSPWIGKAHSPRFLVGANPLQLRRDVCEQTIVLVTDLVGAAGVFTEHRHLVSMRRVGRYIARASSVALPGQARLVAVDPDSEPTRTLWDLNYLEPVRVAEHSVLLVHEKVRPALRPVSSPNDGPVMVRRPVAEPPDTCLKKR